MGAVTVNPVQTSTYYLHASDNPITFGTGTNINAVYPYSTGVEGGSGIAWKVTNYGSIQDYETGVFLGGGRIDNKRGGSIVGFDEGVVGDENATFAVINAGTIRATSGWGVLLGTNGTVDNQSGGTISGAGGVGDVTESNNVTVTNAGMISGTSANSAGVSLYGGTLTNRGTIMGGSIGVNAASTVDNQRGGRSAARTESPPSLTRRAQ